MSDYATEALRAQRKNLTEMSIPSLEKQVETLVAELEKARGRLEEYGYAVIALDHALERLEERKP